MEAAHYFGLHARAWHEESADWRARMLAHMMLMGTYTAYDIETGQKAEKKEENAYETMKRRMGRK